MKVTIVIDKKELIALVLSEIGKKFDGTFDTEKVKIQTKSQQNYKSEWEEADFKAVYEGNV